MGRRKDITELAALLDGELDSRRAEELYAELQADPELRAEYEQQREVKRLLCELPQAEAPSYAETRVLGAIAARRSHAAAVRWRRWAAALGGAAACMLLVIGALLLFVPWQPGFAPVGEGKGAPLLGAQPVGERELRMVGGEVLPFDDWRDFSAPLEAGEGAADFLRFANEAHGYSKMVNTSSGLTPDLPLAILVLSGELNGTITIEVGDSAEEEEEDEPDQGEER